MNKIIAVTAAQLIVAAFPLNVVGKLVSACDVVVSVIFSGERWQRAWQNFASRLNARLGKLLVDNCKLRPPS